MKKFSPLIALVWCYGILIFYYTENHAYYTEKLSVFGTYVLSFVGR